MSDAKWCDIGDHAFPAGQEGSEILSKKRTEKDTHGRKFEVVETLDVCAECNPLTKRKPEPKALEADRFPGEDETNYPDDNAPVVVVHRRNVLSAGDKSICGLSGRDLTFSTERTAVNCKECRMLG